MHAFGFCTPLFTQLKAYLQARQQFVKYRNHVSNPFSPESGVPQGSNLGPLLFVIFINNIVETIFCGKLSYADDLKIYHEVRSVDDCVDLQLK